MKGTIIIDRMKKKKNRNAGILRRLAIVTPIMASVIAVVEDSLRLNEAMRITKKSINMETQD